MMDMMVSYTKFPTATHLRISIMIAPTRMEKRMSGEAVTRNVKNPKSRPRPSARISGSPVWGREGRREGWREKGKRMTREGKEPEEDDERRERTVNVKK